MKIEDLNEIINNRVQTRKKNSYTNKLLKLGPKKIAQKFGEESSELIIDFLKGSKKKNNRRSCWCNLSSSYFVKIKKNYYEWNSQRTW